MIMNERGTDQETESEWYTLRLFITGASANSARAIMNMNSICEAHLKGRYSLEIIDVYQEPHLAEREQIIALPMLIKGTPEPERRLIGDMSNEQKVLRALNIFPKKISE